MFMKVTVPYDNITVVAQDGTKAAAKADTELFSYDVKSGWIEIGTPVKDTNNKNSYTSVCIWYSYSDDSCSSKSEDRNFI